MMEKFNNFLKNGLPSYDAKYINDQKYVLLMMNEKGDITYAFCNQDYIYLVEYPDESKEYNSPIDVLIEELQLCNLSNGIIYENIDNKGSFQPIAYIENGQQIDINKIRNI